MTAAGLRPTLDCKEKARLDGRAFSWIVSNILNPDAPTNGGGTGTG